VRYEEHDPRTAERGTLRLWRLSDEARAEAEPEPVVPDGRVELIVHLGDPFRLVQEGRNELQERLLCAGPGTTAVRLAPSGRADVIGVRIEAGAAARWLEVPVAALRDRIVPLDAVAPRIARGLAEELDAPRRGEDWRAVLERRLGATARRSGTDLRIAAVVDAIRRSGGRRTVEDLAVAHGVSRRQLERDFQARVGLAPKLFARIVRFQGAFARLRAGQALAEVAARTGYFDQAHLVRDCRRFADTTPGRLRAEAPELTGHFADEL